MNGVRARLAFDFLEPRTLLSADPLQRQAVAADALSAGALQRSALVSPFVGSASQASQASPSGPAAPGPSAEYPTGAMLVQVRPGVAGPGPFWTARLAAEGAVLSATGAPDLYKVVAPPEALDRLSPDLRTASGVRYVEPEQTVSIQATPNDPLYANGTQWDMNSKWGIQGPAGWDVTTGSTSVTVADIDTGIDYNHADLYDNVWINQAEIPATRLANLADLDGDGRITVYDLNYTAADGSHPNQGVGKITDINGDGRITGADLLAAMQKDAGDKDTGLGGWGDPNNVQDGDTAHPNDLIGWNFVTNTNDPFDDHGHGTHTAGTIAAMGNDAIGVTGVLWRAQVMGLKFISSGGSGSDSDAAAAITYAANHGARVSNNSWGGAGTSSAIADAISAAATKGMIFVAAAGNNGTNNDTTPFYPANDKSPNVVSVAATDINGALASFSNYGATTVLLAAPGVGITSTTPYSNYAAMSGTSMATPHVTGVIAAVISRHPDWTMSQVIADVANTTTPDPAISGKVATGGIVNLDAALRGTPGAVVLSATPGDGQTVSSVGTFRLTFNEAIAPASFTTGRASLSTPSGPVSASGVAPVDGSGNRQFDVTFPTQTAAGAYSLAVSASVTGTYGDAMDQNRNGVLGEAQADRYTETVNIPSTPPPSSSVTSLWDASSSPSGPMSWDTSAIELGVRFRSDADGYVTGVRFYKGAGNDGPHTGSLWTSGGQLLATASFSGESSTGWQAVTFAAPVRVSAGVTYVASYHTSTGHYASDWGYFSGSGRDSGVLHAPSGANGVFAYGGGGAFPSQSYQSANYWVDVLFATSASSPPPPTPTPPAVTATTPADGATGVSTGVSVKATFNEALDASTVTVGTFTLRDASGNAVAATVTYDTTSNTATLSPSSPLATSTTYTATLVGGTSDPRLKASTGAALAASVSWSFTTAAPTPPPSSSVTSLWDASSSPSGPMSWDTSAIELGVRFRSDADGYVTGVRFYKGAGNDGPHTGSLWTSGGQLLATASFSGESSTGWQAVTFAAPVRVSAGVTYVASYHTSTGHYASDWGYFSGSGRDSGVLHAPSGANGVFAYGGGGAFPSQSYQSANYWVDVLFATA